MRMEQYLEELAASRFAEGHTRIAMSVYNHAYANHYCHRQWQQHHALYVERDGASGPAGGGGGNGGGGNGGNGGNGDAEFCAGDYAMKAILENPKCDRRIGTGDVRILLRNKLMHRGVTKVAQVVNDAVDKLVEAGLVTKAAENEDAQASDPAHAEEPARVTRRPHGRKVSHFKKVVSVDNLSDGARELLTRLQVSTDCFGRS